MNNKSVAMILITMVISFTVFCKDTAKNTPPFVSYQELANPPEPVAEVVPVYPESSKLAGQEGKLLVEITVGPSGRVEEAQIVVSSGYSALDEAGLAAARKWFFTRPLHQGKPVRTKLNIPFKFQLDE